MNFTSKLYPGEIVIDDSNYKDHCHPIQNGERRFFGYQQSPKGFAASKIASGDAASFSFPIIPRSEWDARIADMEQNQTRISDMLLQAGIPSLDQDSTNYCWCNAVVGCVQVVRAQQNQKYVPLSPASVAAPVTGYRNQGGWGGEALDYIVKNGVAAVAQWPANAISQSYFSASRANAALHKVQEYYILNPNDSNIFDQIMTMLFMRIPVSCGLSWWSHEIMYTDPVKLSGNSNYGIRFRNSWGDSYGSKGFNTLTESKAMPDDACSPGVVVASNE